MFVNFVLQESEETAQTTLSFSQSQLEKLEHRLQSRAADLASASAELEVCHQCVTLR